MESRWLKVIDKPFIVAVAVLIGFGLLILASAGTSLSSGPWFYVKKQALFVTLGIAAILWLVRYDYSNFNRFGHYFYGLSILLLLAVLAFGTEQRGTQGWIAIGSLPPVQPAEFTKILLIIAYADFLSQRRERLQTFKEVALAAGYMAVPFLLILAQKDLGTALVYIAITLGMLFVAGANPRVLGVLVAAGALFLSLVLYLHFAFGMWIPLKNYQIDRLTVFLDPYADGNGGRDAGYNIIQAMIAVGSGGLFGKGLFNGKQIQLNFLPEHHTDFIFSVIGEELGFVGCVGLIALYGIIIWRCLVISSRARDSFGSLMIVGIVSMWLFHIWENIGMNIGLMPVTGIPLPFISYGGSSTLTNVVSIGIIIAINLREKRIVF